MHSFSYRTVTTRIFNQPKSFEVCGVIDDKGVIVLTELFIVGKDRNGKVSSKPVDVLLEDEEIRAAIISLLNEWPQGLIFKTKELDSEQI